MQLVLVKSMMDEFTFSEPNSQPDTSATAGTHLPLDGPKLCAEAQMRYCNGIGKLLYLVNWLPEIANSVCELTRFRTEAFPGCVKGMECIMQHVLVHPECIMVKQLDGQWDRLKEFEFEIDSGNAMEPEA